MENQYPLKVTVALRSGENKTNRRSLALAQGLYLAGCQIKEISRAQQVPKCDLLIQTGFSPSESLKSAISEGIPYLIAEAPVFRDMYDVDGASNFTYCGLAGGGYRPPAPQEERRKPALEPLKTTGGTLIIGQKPTDHSLRGSDHVQWLLDKQQEYPTARLRQHPLMVNPEELPPLEYDLSNCRKAITYTSTTCIEAYAMGLEIVAEGLGSEYRDDISREELFHELSWSTFTHSELRARDVGRHIKSGYAQALEMAKAGNQEQPREKLDGKSVCERYYRAIK